METEADLIGKKILESISEYERKDFNSRVCPCSYQTNKCEFKVGSTEITVMEEYYRNFPSNYLIIIGGERVRMKESIIKEIFDFARNAPDPETTDKVKKMLKM